MLFNYNTTDLKPILKTTCAIAMAVMTATASFAAAPEKYAGTSALANGTWVKIDISTPGLQNISRQTLKNFGFSDSKNVYVYGYGGRASSEALRPDLPDDVPAVPVYRKSDGSITFYATGNISIQGATVNSAMEFDHSINPYSESSCYFLSDVAPSAATPTIDLSDTQKLTAKTTATKQIVHERDLLQCAESGRDYLGEDFRSTKSQDFNFDLPDNADGNAKIRVRFGATTTGARSSFIVSANGERLAATNSDKIAEITLADQYYKVATSVKTAENVGDKLTVGIEYSQAGVVKNARLDWIEVEYNQTLKLRDSKLYFHVNPRRTTAYSISGATTETMVWDVTSPWDIKEVKGNFDASAGTLTLAVPGDGLREFMVFNPEAKGAAVPGRTKVANQNIHGMPVPDMVIITPDEFSAAAKRIAALHQLHDGMTVYVLSPEKIYNEFSSGVPDLMAFRKMLKMWYDRGQAEPEGTQLGYCLLMGRPTYDQKIKNPETINSKYPRTLIWQSSGGYTETSSYCTDDFISMLEDEHTTRNMWTRQRLIGIGRYPVRTAEEADIIADKLEAYMTAPDYGTWRNNLLLIADDGDQGLHLSQMEESINWLKGAGAGPHYAYDRVYVDAFDQKQTGAGLTVPDAKEKMLKKWQIEGSAFISYIGHANPKEWTHEKLLTWNDITEMSNQYLPVLYAATCSFGKWDAESVSGAEVLITNPAGGAISVITPSRTVYISLNPNITNAVASYVFQRGKDGLGLRLGDIVKLGKNACAAKYSDDNMTKYHLFGDPALRMPVPRYTVAIDNINDEPLAADVADAPSLMARSSVKLSGRITDDEGNTVDFNGPVQFTLFDAEKSITTHGWGEQGKEMTFQERSSKLATGSTLVKNGQWESTLLIPAEISNNYSPARITCYAYDEEQGAEANGSTEKLYVYGYNLDAPEDTEGPVIERFGINSLTSGDGTVVHTNPVAMAVVGDDSGINISDAGIGHKMSLVLDGNTLFDDVSDFFVPDTEDNRKGSIAYPLSDLSPGEHELKLTVWDNANNSSNATVNFKVGLNMKPNVVSISSVYNRNKDILTLKVNTDRALCKLRCELECFDLNGKLMWRLDRNAYSGKDSNISYTWNIQDNNGNRLPRGIYTLRATVTAEEGIFTSESKKIAIPAK